METGIKKLSIYEALANVNAGLTAIGKNKQNLQQGFKYRGIDDVYNAVNPLFKEFGVICMPEVVDNQRYETENHKGTKLSYTLLKIKYTFYASDGSNVSCVVQGEGMDSGDKSSNKAMAVAHKYALCQMFCIPTEDMADPDKDSPQLGTKPKPLPKQETEKPKPAATAVLFDPKRVDGFKKWAEDKDISVEVNNNVITVSGKTFDHKTVLSQQGFRYDSASKTYSVKLSA